MLKLHDFEGFLSKRLNCYYTNWKKKKQIHPTEALHTVSFKKQTILSAKNKLNIPLTYLRLTFESWINRVAWMLVEIQAIIIHANVA